MSKTIKPSDLGAAIAEELTLYNENILEQVDAAGEKAVKALVKKTKATAPMQTGSFVSNIAWKKVSKGATGNRFVWYVKAPDYRITHLLVHGHAGNGHRGDPFLKNALEDVLPAYERDVQEAIKNGK